MQLARMKDDPKTNMAFVASVRRHPVLYDYTLPGHSSRELQDEAWHRVAQECADTVGNCKERWKNLRASLCRHLRQQQAASQAGQRPKKPYYLAEHMEFVVPFTKTRPLGSINTAIMDSAFDPMDYMDEVKQEVDEDEDSLTSQQRAEHSADGSASIDEDVLVQNSLGSSWADRGDGPAVLQVLDGPLTSTTSSSSRKRKMSSGLAARVDSQESYADEADLNFLKSLLPDMAVMSARQKNTFKMAVLSAIEKIVYSAPSADNEAELRAQPHATQSGTS